MANASTLYRFNLEVSDVERSFYGSVDLRAAMHPSETTDYLLTRVIAYALNFEDGLEMNPGLCVDGEPAIRLPGASGSNGKDALWIEIGSPSARRLHKASKSAERLKVYTYKDPENLIREASGEKIHRAEMIEIIAISPKFLGSLAKLLKRDNTWSLIHNEGELVIGIDETSVSGTLSPYRLGTL